jgi:hypothetical protein
VHVAEFSGCAEQTARWDVSIRAQIKLGRIAGIAIGLHYSWFIIAFLIALSLVGQFRAITPGWSNRAVWAFAVVTSVLFFVVKTNSRLIRQPTTDHCLITLLGDLRPGTLPLPGLDSPVEG